MCRVATLILAILLMSSVRALAQDERTEYVDRGTEAEVAAALGRALELSPTPFMLRAQQAEREASGWPLSLQTDKLEEQVARDKQIAATSVPNAGALEGGCVAALVDRCRSFSAGSLTGDEHTLYWQLQDQYSRGANGDGGIVFYVRGPERDGNTLRPIAWALRRRGYDPPVLWTEVWSGPDGQDQWSPMYLIVRTPKGWLPSVGYRDLLFRWTPGAERELTEIDTLSWEAELERQLPEGMQVLGYPYIDYEGGGGAVVEFGNYTSPIVRGEALVGFKIEGDRLAIEDVTRVNPTGRLTDLP